MLTWLLKFLPWCKLLAKHLPEGCIGMRDGARCFASDQRFFGRGRLEVRQFGNVNSHSGQSQLQRTEVSQEPRAVRQQAEHQDWPGEVITLPWRRRVSRLHTRASALPVTHDVTRVAHGGERSKGAERQARYRAKDPDGYRRHHREYMAARRARAKASKASNLGSCAAEIAESAVLLSAAPKT